MAALPVAPCPSAGRRYRHRRAPGVVCAPDGGGVARSVRGSAVGWSRRRGPEAGLAAESFVPGRVERPSAWRAGCPQVGVRCWSFGSDLGASGQSRVRVRSRSLQVDARRARVEPGWREERCLCSVLSRVIPCRDTYTGVCKLTELRAVLAAGRSVWNFWVFISR